MRILLILVIYLLISSCSSKSDKSIYTGCLIGTDYIMFENSETGADVEYIFTKSGITIRSKPIAYAKSYEDISRLRVSDSGNVDLFFGVNELPDETFSISDKSCLSKLVLFLKENSLQGSLD